MKFRCAATFLLSILMLLSMNAMAEEGSFSIGVGLGYSSFNLNETNLINSSPDHLVEGDQLSHEQLVELRQLIDTRSKNNRSKKGTRK